MITDGYPDELFERPPLDQNVPCKVELKQNVNKVRAYTFPRAQGYINGKNNAFTN